MQNLSMAHGPHHEPAEDSALGLEMQATEAVLFYSSCYFTHVSFDPGEPNDYTNDSCSHALGYLLYSKALFTSTQKLKIFQNSVTSNL